jgi:cytochrome c oxidase subunit 4
MSSEHSSAAAAVGEHAEGEEHVLPVKTYLAVFAALVGLTYVTVQVSLLELGSVAIYVAMGVAIIKAALVVGYFMHLKFDVRFNAFIFLSSLLFLLIFFVLTMIDLGTRGAVVDVQDNFVLRQDRAAARQAAEAKKAAEARKAAEAKKAAASKRVEPRK